jgi:hypothetical protein
VHAAHVGRDVDVDDVAVLQGAAVGDAVADHLVDRGAQGLGEAPVAERRRVGAVVEQELVADSVDLVRGDAGRDDGGGRRHGLSGDAARDPHLLDRLRVLDLRAVVPSGLRLADVLRSGDRRGHGAAGRDLPGGHACERQRHTVESRCESTPSTSEGTMPYWYNVASGQVETDETRSKGEDVMGPYETEAEAARALDTARERTERWDEEDRKWEEGNTED